MFRLNESKANGLQNGQQLRNNLNIGNFDELHDLVRKEMNESQTNEKFFADDDLFSL